MQKQYKYCTQKRVCSTFNKVCQFKGSTQNSNRQTGFCFGYFQEERDHPPVSLGFTKKMASKQVKRVKLSLRWGL